MTDVDEFIISHHGVKGQKWGIRHKRPQGLSRRTDHEAEKDAKEFARAKQFFGEGAGTRRKLIKAKVEAKKKRDPAYARAFDEHLSNQDASKHVSKAVSERRRKDILNKNKQRAGFVARNVTGQQGTQAAFTALALSGVAFLSTPKGQELLKQTVSRISTLANRG